jgi:hypothetical protein
MQPLGNRPDRAQTSPLSVLLILSITLTAATVIVVFGGAALEGVQQESQVGQAEQAMTQFDSRTAQVALGDSSSQNINIGQQNGNYRVDEDAGAIRIYHEDYDNNGSIEYIYGSENNRKSLGAVVYEGADTRIAYQGGGVWRENSAGSSTMVSPPEFHYRDATLTFPLIRVNGDDSAGGRTNARVTHSGVDPVFPHPDETYDGSTEPYENPMENGSILVEIRSRYCTGWESFFESRSEGSIEQRCAEEDANTVVVDLTAPFEQTFENEVIVTDNYIQNGNGGEADWKKSNRPSVSDVVDEQINDCVNGTCNTSLSDLNGKEIDEGTYYFDSELSVDGATFNTTDGNITLVVDGGMDVSGDNPVEGDGEVQVYLDEGYDLKGSINGPNGTAKQFQVYVHSDADLITHGGSSYFAGVVYAPNTDIEQQGSGTVKGALVGEVIRVNGNPSNTFETAPSLDGFSTELSVGGSPITYLHVTENRVDVELN